jgi:hypothetical protein
MSSSLISGAPIVLVVSAGGIVRDRCLIAIGWTFLILSFYTETPFFACSFDRYPLNYCACIFSHAWDFTKQCLGLFARKYGIKLRLESN